jgi:AcrR family transcriptional regulator
MSTPVRSDAIKRRALLLEAAAEVFAEQGYGAPMDAIAARAGVGQGTLYRNFADRDALMLALATRGLDQLEADLQDAAPADHTLAMLEAMAEHSVVNPTACEYWTQLSPDSPELLAAEAHFKALAGRGLPAAIAAGRVRPDLTAEDIHIMAVMFGAIRIGQNEAERRAVKQRVLSLLMQGLVP